MNALADKLALAVDDYRAARARRSSATSAVLQHIGTIVAENVDTIVTALRTPTTETADG